MIYTLYRIAYWSLYARDGIMILDMKIAPSELVTSRLGLRKLRDEDIEPFAAMNADARVMEFFPRTWSFEESKAALVRIEEGFQDRGFGIYAVECQSVFSGIVGLSVPSFEAHFTPCVEILWRLVPPVLGKRVCI